MTPYIQALRQAFANGRPESDVMPLVDAIRYAYLNPPIGRTRAGKFPKPWRFLLREYHRSRWENVQQNMFDCWRVDYISGWLLKID